MSAASVILILLFLTSSATGRILTVDYSGDGDYRYFTDAIAASQSGDTIFVSSNVHELASVIIDKEITIRSEGIILGQAGGGLAYNEPVFIIRNTNNVVIEGLHIAYEAPIPIAVGKSNQQIPALISCENCSAIIRNNIMHTQFDIT